MKLCAQYFNFNRLINQLNLSRLISWNRIFACVVASLWSGFPVISMAESINITTVKCGEKVLSFENVYRTFQKEAITVKVAEIPARFPDIDFINVIKSTHQLLDLNKASPDSNVSFVLSSQSECLQNYLNYIYKKFELGTSPFYAKIRNPTKNLILEAFDKKFLLILSEKMPKNGFSWSSEKNLTYFTLPLLNESELKNSLQSLEVQLSQEILHEFYIQRDVFQNIGNGYAVDDELSIEKNLSLTTKQIRLLIHPCSRTALAQYRAMQFEMQKLSLVNPLPQEGCAKIVAQYDPTPIASFFDLLLTKIADADFVAAAKKKSDPTINRWMEEFTKLDQLYYDQRSMDISEYNLKRRFLDLQLDSLRIQYNLEFKKKYKIENRDCQTVAKEIQKSGLSEEVCRQLKTPKLIDDLDAIYRMTMGPRCASCSGGSHTPDSSRQLEEP
jgi:hypothetical protein